MNDTDPQRICPTCGHSLDDRAGYKSRGNPRGYPYEPRMGEEPGNGFNTDVTWFHYIPLGEKSDWETLGWVVSDLDSHHGRYSVLGKWAGAGPPRVPKDSPA